jgi:hypothetical protein
MAKPHTPMTTDVRAAYAAGQDSYFYTDEGHAIRNRLSYADRALGFDRWLEATIAVGRAQAFAEGKAEGIKAMAAAVKADLKPEAEENIGSADSAQGYKAGVIAAGFIVDITEKETLKKFGL